FRLRAVPQPVLRHRTAERRRLDLHASVHDPRLDCSRNHQGLPPPQSGRDDCGGDAVNQLSGLPAMTGAPSNLVKRGRSMQIRKQLLAAISIAAFAGCAAAQQFPNHPVTMVVPYAAGGPTDTVARVMGVAMAKPL